MAIKTVPRSTDKEVITILESDLTNHDKAVLINEYDFKIASYRDRGIPRASMTVNQIENILNEGR